MSETPPSVIGRERELAAVDAFLAAEDGFPGALVLEGEAGIGKTTLWRAGIAGARERGCRVLVCGPAGSEVELAYAALGDLLTDAGEAIAGLPAPQVRALNAALLVETAGGAPDRRAVAAGLLNVLRTLAQVSPLLLAVDDVQWLDGESAAALEFAARRLHAEPVALLIARRLGSGGEQLERALPPDRLRRLEVGPLALGPLHELIKQRLGATLARPVLLRLLETSAGNPFFALELARALIRRGATLDPGRELPVPADLRELVASRLAALPRETTVALRAVSALADPRLELVAAAAGADPLTALAPAFEGQLVELRDGRVVFSHPLFASAVYAELGPDERRVLHRRLAAVVGDIEERARHLALGTTGPNGDVAALLEAAARRTAERGAPAGAAELVDLAIGLTPRRSVSDRHRRRLLAYDLHTMAGSRGRSRRLLGELERDARPGRERAEVLFRLADDRERARALAAYRDALVEAAGEAELEGEIEHRLGFVLAFLGDLESARAHLRRAIELLDGGDGPALADSLAGCALLDIFAADPAAAPLLDRALALERRFGGPLRHHSPLKVAGLLHMYHGRVAQARPFLEEFAQRAVAHGNELLHLNGLAMLAQLECQAGRLQVAEAHAAQLAELAEQVAEPSDEIYPRAIVAAYRGRVDDARRFTNQFAEEAEANSDAWRVAMAASILGFLELSHGDHAAAWQLLGPLPARLDSMGYGEVGWLPPLFANAIEAAVGVGELDRAGELAQLLEARSRRVGSPAGLIGAERGAGLVAAAAGAYDDAFAAFARALAEEAQAPAPIERARTLLSLGAAQRRAKRWADARRSLEVAVAAFDRLGVALWAERARDELARVPGRTSRRKALTPTEQRVAELVAQGRSNKEVAATLFVTVKAVEATLTRVYAKLGLRSRTELAGRLAQVEEPKL